MNILDVRNLSKHYKQLTAVNDISFTVKAGICFGLLGPNGAGKTTTIEMIEGLTSIDSGEILYKGAAITADFQQSAGIQFQQTALMDFLTVKETLTLFASFYQNPLPLPQLVELCQLEEFLQQSSTRLSGGQRQRLLLALALINNPEIVFLDEPTTGLDPQSRHRFWQLIEDIKAQGKTIILTTHYMDEAEKLCDELLIIDHGRIIDQGSPQALLAKHFHYKRISLAAADFAKVEARSPYAFEQHGARVILKTTSLEDTLDWLRQEQVPLASMTVENPNLDDLFLKLTGTALRQ